MNQNNLNFLKNNISAISIPGYQATEIIYVSSKTTVYRGYHQQTKTPVIIKILNDQYPRLRNLIAVKNQFAIMQKIQHPGIIKCYDLVEYSNSYALILEDCHSISLSEYVKTYPLDINLFFKIGIDIVRILEVLHQNKIIHKDIKPKNIIINPENQQIKIIDFSISSLLPKENTNVKIINGLEGTLSYMSPEQTGRMNKSIDYRTDFYSLGVTFYELLTGQLPFNSKNSLELVYCHLAKAAINPKELNPQIPKCLADIIIKLMEKNPEDRYQTAAGIGYDLEKCQQMLLEKGEITKFTLAEKDISDRFIIPDKIYGRQEEIHTLLNVFEYIRDGHKQLILITGFSGIGKTTIVNQIHQPIIREQGYFISGKYDQFQKDIPFSALLQAFRSLMRQLLTESKTQLEQWKNQILSALREQAQVIIDVIPELENIIGKQPPIPELTGNASQNRFNLLFSKFIQVLAKAEHPLVIFLDDLQWVDPASLKLIKLLITDNEPKYLLLIGAYRDNEVNPTHPLTIALEDIKQTEITINQITLEPLKESDIKQLIKDTLFCPEADIQPLSELIVNTTKGNPFFINQLLKSLHEDGLITFDLKLGYWRCDINAAKILYHHDDIIKFITSQLTKLPHSTQEILKIAACIGNRFDLTTLSIVCQKSPSEISEELWTALQEQFILPENETYKFFTDNRDNIDQYSQQIQTILVEYKFLHDRVQQTAYSLIPENEKLATHLKIGQLLLKNSQYQAQQENILAIVNQLNIGRNLINSQAEKYELAKLNLIAGSKAKSSTAYDAAIKYLQVGLELLPPDSWNNEYELTLNLYIQATETEYLNINFTQAENYIKIVKENTKQLIDTIEVEEIKIAIYIAQMQIKLGIDTGLNLIRLLGFNLEKAPPPHLNVDELINLPDMNGADKIATMRILTNLTAASYFVDASLFPQIIFTMIHLSNQYGNCSFSAHGYINYGVILCGFLSDIDTGYRLGEIALSLLEKFDAKTIKCRVLLMWNANIAFWKKPLRENIPSLRAGLQSGIETGDLEYFSYSSAIYIISLILSGENLEYVSSQADIYVKTVDKFQQGGTIILLNIWQQLVWNFSQIDEDNLNKHEFSGKFFQEAQTLPILLTSKSSTVLFSLFLAKTIFYYFFGYPELAINSSVAGSEYLKFVVGQVTISHYNFYYSLSLLAAYPHQSNTLQQEYLEIVSNNQKQLLNWAKYAPSNYQHKYNLVAAEQARVLGNYWQAMELYDQAIIGAKKHKYLQEEALANELAAKFYLSHHKEKIAKTYLIDAYYCYGNWNAKARIYQLENTYPELLANFISPAKTDVNKNQISILVSDSRMTSASALLDLETVTKASLAISSEIKIDKLLATLMQVILENVAANKSALILRRDDNFLVVALVVANCNTALECYLEPQVIDNNDIVPLTIINYVNHTEEYLLIHDATIDKEFSHDTYIIKYKPKSILCTPILNKGELIGIIYLENNLTIGAFTQERLKILNLIASQAAISLENAQLYSQLEEKVKIRTQELNEKNLELEQTLTQLKNTQSQLIQTEKMSSLGQMVAGVAHEINNPINFIYANVEHARDYIECLIEFLEIYNQEYPQPTARIATYQEENHINFLLEDLPKILDSMMVGSERIRNIVLGLRNFSRLDESAIKPVDVHEGIDNTIMLLSPRFQEKLGYSQNIVIKNYGKIPLVKCYASQLNQVFMNIISNGIDALKERQNLLSNKDSNFHIIITTQVVNNYVQISIKDNGIGIKPEIKNRIFDPFFTTKPVGEGTGLGLSISYQIIVDKHNGRLDCISEVNKGTEFIIAIPLDIK
ncbi:AAA family ATPase [Anabaena sp. FACHB-1237]|uniref:ATP-binding sensor histidine kinase n=1 Tax=Anabaena sp. FACHB-1237 TaxID=2692769 RepID=UPI00168137F2|nr:ATP-binding sensor histidine kinase [Anabaena sp. FACHB-1237]MBD2138272.1 AAA family ATPase [Anabaena sp. FACHB-1237]